MHVYRISDDDQEHVVLAIDFNSAIAEHRPRRAMGGPVSEHGASEL